MSLLTVIQKSADLLNIPRPLFVAGNTDQQVRQLFALTNEEGDELAQAADWEYLREQYIFTTVAQDDQTSAVPADLDRFISNSFFNRTTRRTIIGPITPQQWQAIKAQPQLNRVFLAFVQRHGKFLVTPTPAAGQEIAYEYVSKNWCHSSTGTPQSEYLIDSDEAYLDERLIILGVRWRFLKSKGLDYAEDFRTYMSQRTQKMARDGANSEISTTGDDQYILSPNIPEGSFPGP